MAMNLDALYSALRNRIGNPPLTGEGTVTDRTLLDFLTRGMEYLAGELQFSITTATTGITLVADTIEYEFPDDVLEFLWIEHNGVRLTPSSADLWERDGVDWRDATSATPREYAVQGRNVIFYPPPNAAAVTADSTPDFRYIATAPALSSAGTDRLGDQDQMLAVYWAAWNYCLLHGAEPGMKERAKANEAALQQQLIHAHRRRMEAHIHDYRPSVVFTTRRTGAAR